MPSEEVAAYDPVEIAQNTVPFQANEYQLASTGNVRRVQVTPSGEVAAIVVAQEIAANIEPPHTTVDQYALGIDCCVQVIPSGDVAAIELESATVQNIDPLQETISH